MKSRVRIINLSNYNNDAVFMENGNIFEMTNESTILINKAFCFNGNESFNFKTPEQQAKLFEKNLLLI